MDDSLIIELWENIKHHIPAKERTDAAYNIARVFDEHGLLEGVEHQTGLDKYLNAALVECGVAGFEDEDDEY